MYDQIQHFELRLWIFEPCLIQSLEIKFLLQPPTSYLLTPVSFHTPAQTEG